MQVLRSSWKARVAGLPWHSKPHRFFTWFLAACLAVYVTYAAFVSGSGLFVSAADTAATLLWAVGLILLAFFALGWFMHTRGAKPFAATRTRLRLVVFALGTAVPLAILGVYLLAAYPGGVTVDSAVQWTQAGTGTYINWHPVFHTLLLRLSQAISPSYPFAVMAQCVLFSIGLGYLLATLAAWGLRPLWLFLAAGITVASPIVGNTMMYLWKDNAMTIGVVVLLAQGVNLYLSRGEWLRRRRNAIAYGLTLAFTTLVRHNALLFTVPLLLVTLFTCHRQLWQGLISTLVMLGVLALVLGPLYSALHVVYPQNGMEEAIGLPMTVISNIRKQNPSALDAETRAFTDQMAGEAGWEAYQLDNYNSIKFGATRALIARTPLSQVLRMAVSAAKADPRTAFLAVNGMTDLVWGLANEGAANVQVRNSGHLPSVAAASGRRNAVGTALKALIQAPLKLNVLAWYYGNLGVSFLCLMVCALRALRRNGMRVLLLCLPVLLYNLGTMLVLCGEDARFFAFSPLLCTLSLFVLTRDAASSPDIQREKAA